MNDRILDPRKIRWIAFDAVDTLIRPTPSVGSVYHDIGVRHGSRLPREQIVARFRQAFARTNEEGTLSCNCPDANEEWHTCESRERMRWKIIVETVLDDVSSQQACFEELFTHFGLSSSWICFPDVEPALMALRERGIRLAVSSNFDERLHPVMDGLPALGPIELRVISSLVGYRKPSRRFFERLLHEAGCDAAEVLFIGDNPQSDVAAAQAAGLSALLIDRAAPRSDNRVLNSLTDLLNMFDIRSQA
jgi:putative hydrolase of the HAD superfamily